MLTINDTPEKNNPPPPALRPKGDWKQNKQTGKPLSKKKECSVFIGKPHGLPLVVCMRGPPECLLFICCA